MYSTIQLRKAFTLGISPACSAWAMKCAPLLGIAAAIEAVLPPAPLAPYPTPSA